MGKGSKNNKQKLMLLMMLSMVTVDTVPLFSYATPLPEYIEQGELKGSDTNTEHPESTVNDDEVLKGTPEEEVQQDTESTIVNTDEGLGDVEEEDEIIQEESETKEESTEPEVTPETKVADDLVTETPKEEVSSFKTMAIQETPTYVLATDADFSGSNGSFKYIGDDEYVEIPHTIRGQTVTSYYSMFSMANVKGVKSTNKRITTMSYMFSQNKATTLDVSQLDTTGVSSMPGLFQSSEMTTITGLENFDTSKVTMMETMFNQTKVTYLDLSSFDTSNVIGFGQMFGNSAVTYLDVSSFNTSRATNMGNMFYNSKVPTLDLRNFDTSNVSSMGGMFYNTGTTLIDVSSFDTSKVQDMYEMFAYSNAPNLDVSIFGTGEVKNMGSMFANSKATSIEGLTGFSTGNLTNMTSMFEGAKAKDIDLSSFDTGRITDMTNVFKGSGVENIKVSNFDTKLVIDMSGMFKDTKLSSLDLSSFDMTGVNSTDEMLSGTTATKGLSKTREDSNVLNGSKGKPESLVFSSQYVLATDEDFSGTLNGYFKYIGGDSYVEIPQTIKGVKVNSYKGMFSNMTVKGVTSTNKNVTDMSDMFKGNTSENLGIALLDTTNVTNMSGMFQDTKAKVVDLRGMDTRKVTDMSNMFRGSSATILDLSTFNLTTTSSLPNMFTDAKATIGYARTSEDAVKLNSSSGKQTGLTFTVRGITTTQDPESWTNGAVNIAVDADFGDVGIQYIELLNGGGRNYFRKDTMISRLTGAVNTYKEPSTNGFYLDSPEGSGNVRINNVINGNGYYTFSADVMSTVDATISLDFNDNRTEEIELKAGEWARLESTHNVTNWSRDVYRFIDINGLPKGKVSFKDVKIEEGKVGTPWIPAIEDSGAVGDSNAFPVYTNGTYLFRATDTSGNTKTVAHTVTTIDKELPTAKMTKSTEGWTSQDVTVYVNAEDKDSGVRHIILPNGTRVTGNIAEFKAPDNGTYAVKVYDNAGNETTQTINITNIDRSIPSMKAVTDTTEWTRGIVGIGVTSEVIPSGIQTIEMISSPGTGVNLLKGTKDEYQEYTTTNEYYRVIGTDITLEEGEAYTFSWKGEHISGFKTYLSLGIGHKGEYLKDLIYYGNSVDSKEPMTFTPTKQDLATYKYFSYRVRNDRYDSRYKIGGIKLEKGKVATPWTPEPTEVPLINNGKYYPVASNGLYTFQSTYNNGVKSEVSVNVTNIDREAPKLDIKGNPEDWEEDDEITLSIKATDTQSGVKSITLPNNQVVNGDSATFKVAKNGEYKFTVEDNIGNTYTHTEKVEYLMIPYNFYIYDSNNKPLEGAGFELHRNGEAYKEATSDATGLVDFGKVPPVGKYTIIQVKAPDGQVINPDPVEVGDITDPEEFISYPRGTTLPSTGTLDGVFIGLTTLAVITWFVGLGERIRKIKKETK